MSRKKSRKPVEHGSSIPVEGYIRLHQLIGTRATPGAVPVSRATLWRMVRTGSFPAPVKLGCRIVAWRVDEVRQWLVRVSQ